jgi:hypothetical protein
VPSSYLIQLNSKLVWGRDTHWLGRKNDAGCRAAPPLSRRETTVNGLPDDCSDGHPALPCRRANPLVALVIQKDLKSMTQHTHTLACVYQGAGDACAGHTALASMFRGTREPTTISSSA